MPVPFEVNFKRTLGKQLKEEDFRQQFFKTHGGLTSFWSSIRFRFTSAKEKRKAKETCFHQTCFFPASLQSLKSATALNRFLSGFNPLLRWSPAFNCSRENSRNCSAFRPFLIGSNMDRRANNNSSGNSPLRMSPSSSVAGLINGERKKPFLIGVAGGTASGKVEQFWPLSLLWSFRLHIEYFVIFIIVPWTYVF